jgi:hypothetical protein
LRRWRHAERATVMRREEHMRHWFTAITLVALWAPGMFGCGSTTDDSGVAGIGGPQPGLVMRFSRFDTTGLIQQDAVFPTSAQVDVTPSLCSADFFFTELEFEEFTQTVINVAFINEERSDILLQGYTMHFNDPELGIGDQQYNVAALLRGRRCSNNLSRACTVDSDCVIPGQMAASDTCDASETLVQGVMLFDFLTKQLLRGNPKLQGMATTVTLSFFGADPNRTFRANAAYVVTFDDFCNCPDGTFCVPPGVVPGF